ncbi:hypothetical protein [Nakamurella lactea]|uniref:hypothetical protein n=1 Tax=Nakamurella lactea TaxID=459515 RepID=UPI00042450CE|nr:hypothetical protein [Nakamurella lactea]
MTLDEMLGLPGAPLSVAATLTGADTASRATGFAYQGMTGLDAIDTPGGGCLYLRGEELVLIYLGDAALPTGLDDESLRTALGTAGDELPSREGKTASLHVVADQGVAWSEDNGAIGFVELFPPTTGRDYRRRIYRKPPKFVR